MDIRIRHQLGHHGASARRAVTPVAQAFPDRLGPGFRGFLAVFLWCSPMRR
jgi:hypothetical protein